MRQEKRKRILVSTHQLDEMSMIESRLKARDYDVTTAETSIDVIHHVNKQHFELFRQAFPLKPHRANQLPIEHASLLKLHL